MGLQMMSDQLKRETRQLKLRSGSTFAQSTQSTWAPRRANCFVAQRGVRAAGPPTHPRVKTARGAVRDSNLAVPKLVPKQPAPVTKPQATAPVTKPQATAPVTKPEAAAKRSGPPTELSKLDDRVGVLQLKLANYEEKLHDLLQTSSRS